MMNLFDRIRANLENRPAPDFREADWELLEQKLDQKPSSSSRNFSWLFLLFIPLLFSNFLMYSKMKNTEDRILVLENERVDTVYITKIIKENNINSESENIAANSLALQAPKSSIQKPSKKTNKNLNTNSLNSNSISGFSFNDFTGQRQSNWKAKLNTSLAANKNQLIKEYFAVKNQSNPRAISSNSLTNKKINEFNTLASLEAKPITYGRAYRDDLLFTAATIRPKSINPAYWFYPKTLRIGLGGGFGLPLMKLEDDVYISDYSIRMEVDFYSPLRLLAEGRYTQIGYKIENENTTIVSKVPEILAPSDDYQLEEIKIKGSEYEFNLGLQYVFNKSKSWSPFIGAGIGTRFNTNYKLDYKFEKENNDHDEVTIRSNINRNITLGRLYIQSGINYRFNQHWEAQLLANYRTYWKKNNFEDIDQIGVKATIYYVF